MPRNFIYEAIYFTSSGRTSSSPLFSWVVLIHLAPSVYLNALLATLNARPVLRQYVTGELISVVHLDSTTTAIRTVDPTDASTLVRESRAKEVRYHCLFVSFVIRTEDHCSPCQSRYAKTTGRKRTIGR